MQMENFFQTMNDGTEIAVNRWKPDNDEDIKCVIQLSHGMSEHSLRYDRLGSILAEKGYVLSAHDHRGHGRTAQNAEQKGFGLFGKLADKNGFNKVVSDLDEVILKLKSDFPGKKIVVLSHSFGSFVAQAYMENYGEKVQGSILCGSTGPGNKKLALGDFATKVVKFFRGSSYKSKALDKLFFNDYLKRVPNPETSKDWICKNPTTLMMYQNDAWCGGIPTVSFLNDIVYGLKTIHKPANMKKVPLDLPVLILAGTEDPVSNYGETLNNLANVYKENGMKSVELKFYENCRHEIINEDKSDDVIDDIIKWIEKNVK